MAIERRKVAMLAALLVVLAVIVYRAVGVSPMTPAASGGARSSNGSAGRASQAQRGQETGAPDVHLGALGAERPKPGTTDRNLFRFKPKAPPPPPRGTTPQIVEAAAPPLPTGPPPPPPINLKFIGVVEQSGGKPKIAILSDGQGPPLYGMEGGVVAGRYRIVRIGVESIEMSYLDGRGRQTIRLTGS